jgi:Flp pilus assembly protein CpaB
MADASERPRALAGPRSPGSRAVAGGLLVALAVALSLRTAGADDGPPSTRFLIADADLAVGDELRHDDLRSVAIDLPVAQAAHAIRADESLAGAVALGPIRRGQLLASSDVLRAAPETGVEPVRELSIPVSTERALDGRVTSGEIIDVLATTGTGIDAATELVADDVRVLSVGNPDDSLSRAGIVVLTLAVPDDATALALAHAAATADLSIVRGVTR